VLVRHDIVRIVRTRPLIPEVADDPAGNHAAGEDAIPGVTLDALAAAVRRSVKAPVDIVPRLEDVVAAIVRVAKPGDLVITLGAGSIASVPDRLVDALAGASSAATTGGGPSPVARGGSDRGNLQDTGFSDRRARPKLEPPDEDRS